MSVWKDIHRRSNGHAFRKEDTIQEENFWQNDVDGMIKDSFSKWKVIGQEINKLRNENIKLNKRTYDLIKELNRFKWNKKCK